MKPRERTLEARAIGYLARREYSCAELRERLLADGADRDEVEALLAKLIARKLLSDQRYAEAVVGKKAGAYSRRTIRDALRAKGVADDTATQALAARPVDDGEALIALWRRRFSRAPTDERDKARQVRFLQSRGFALSAIFKLLRDPPAED